MPVNRRPSFKSWKRAVDRLVKASYCINTIEAGIEEERLRDHWEYGDTPLAFVEYFAEKYDLAHDNKV